MVLLHRKRQIAVAQETAEGTLISPILAAHVARNISNVTFSPDVEQYVRDNFRETIGRIATIPGVKTGRIGYTSEMVGSGDAVATPPPWNDDVLACGYRRLPAEIITITGSLVGTFLAGEVITGGTSGATAIVAIPNWPDNATTLVVHTVTGTFQSETITGGTSSASAAIGADAAAAGFLYLPTSTFDTGGSGEGSSYSVVNLNDGVRNPIAGARGNFRLRARTGEPLQMEFEFFGPLQTTVDAALVSSVTYPLLLPPQFLNVALNIGAFEPVFDSIELSPGNVLEVRRNANSAAGVISTWIQNRDGTGGIDPEKTLVATEDFYGKFEAGTEFPISFRLGSSAGNRFYLHCPRAQYVDPSESNRGAITTMQMGLNLNQYLGNDELIIAAV